MPVRLPPHIVSEWRPIETRTERSRIALATIGAEISLYEHGATADALRLESELGGSTIPVRSLFTVDLTFAPSLPSLGIAPKAVFSIAAPRAKRQFVRFVEEQGVHVQDERKSIQFERDDGTRGTWSVLEVAHPVDPALTSDGSGAIDAETHVVLWPTADSYGLAGGTLPLEAPEGLEGALEIDPERDRETIVELVRSVEFSRKAEDSDDQTRS